jgi:hypothetical protein
MTKLLIIDENDKHLTVSEVEKNNKNHLLFEIGNKFVVLDDKDAAQLVNYVNAYFENLDL